jgi:4-diphosphocytidyl-2-C-methyl-D-erythritol kinase
MSVRVFAPAKINLTLQVGRPRADGRHPLQSVVMFADIGDWIEAAPADTVSLTITGRFAPTLANDDHNLVIRAARALSPDRGAALCLEKNLPIASGIGGGSSDAAATLKALNALWALNLSDAALIEIARDLGADVPVCIAARTAYMTGAGETFVHLEGPRLAAVLVNPLSALSTAAVYREFDRMNLGAAFAEQAPPVWRSSETALASIKAIGNDLWGPAASLMPEIATIAETLRADPRALRVGLSGSGATLFALTASHAEAAALAQALQARAPHWWVRSTTLG